MAVKIENLPHILRQLQDLGADIEDLKDVMARIAAEGSEVMQGFIPTKSGKLRASTRGNRAKAKAVVTTGRASVPYAGPINYGWRRRNITPADFTGKTDQVMETKATQMLEQGITDLIKRRNLT